MIWVAPLFLCAAASWGTIIEYVFGGYLAFHDHHAAPAAE